TPPTCWRRSTRSQVQVPQPELPEWDHAGRLLPAALLPPGEELGDLLLGHPDPALPPAESVVCQFAAGDQLVDEAVAAVEAGSDLRDLQQAHDGNTCGTRLGSRSIDARQKTRRALQHRPALPVLFGGADRRVGVSRRWLGGAGSATVLDGEERK